MIPQTACMSSGGMKTAGISSFRCKMSSISKVINIFPSRWDMQLVQLLLFQLYFTLYSIRTKGKASPPKLLPPYTCITISGYFAFHLFFCLMIVDAAQITYCSMGGLDRFYPMSTFDKVHSVFLQNLLPALVLELGLQIFLHHCCIIIFL